MSIGYVPKFFIRLFIRKIFQHLVNIYAHQEQQQIIVQGRRKTFSNRNVSDLTSSELSEMEKNLKMTSSPFVYVFIVSCIYGCLCVYVGIYTQTYKTYMGILIVISLSLF